jgi:hypothetical protein
MAVAMRYSTFVAWGTDASGYLKSAHRFVDGRLVTPLPTQLWLTWTPDPWALVPLGGRPGVATGTQVSSYPLGLPVLMAAAIHVGGELAAYAIPPLAFGVLVFCAYRIAAWLAGPWSGLLAAGLLAASPVSLVMAMQPMSDVPAAALWALAWVMSLRPGLGASAAAGAAVTAAVMVRPNLTPLGLIVAWLVATTPSDDEQRSSTRQRFAVFALVAAIGPLVVGWSQAVLNGSPFRTGYHPWVLIPGWENVRPSLALYPRLLTVVHTPAVFLGLLAPLLLLWPAAGAAPRSRARRVLISATAFVVATYLLYAPFAPYDDLLSVRFMLPALTGLFVLLSALLVQAARAIAARARILAPLALVPAAIVATHPIAPLRYGFNLHRQHQPAATAGHYLREALPHNAAVIAGVHSGVVAYYTKKTVIRVEAIPPDGLDFVVDDLARHGYRPVLLLDAGEAATFTVRHRTSSFRDLAWPPRADFADGGLRYWEFADRAAFENGRRWPTDTFHTRR